MFSHARVMVFGVGSNLNSCEELAQRMDHTKPKWYMLCPHRLQPSRYDFFLTFSTLFSPSTGIQRVREGHPSAYLTNYKIFIVIFCYLAHTFHAPLVP